MALMEGPEGPGWVPSTSVENAVSRLPPDEPVTADVVVEAILDGGHRSEYAGGLAVEWSPEPDRLGADRRTPESWIERVSTLFDPDRAADPTVESAVQQQSASGASSFDGTAPILHGRLAIVGLALLDPGLRRRLQRGGILSALEAEIEPPVEALFTAEGRRLYELEDQVSPLDDRPLRSAEQDRLDRAAFAAYLAERIAYLRLSSGRSISVHLYGPWGSGKSTLFNFLSEDLLRRRAPVLSQTVTEARDSFERREPVSAAELATAVLEASSFPDVDVTVKAGSAAEGIGDGRPSDAWLEEVRTLFDEDRARTLDAGLVLVGLAMLNGDVRESLQDGGVLARLERELGDLDALLTDRGHLRRVPAEPEPDAVVGTGTTTADAAGLPTEAELGAMDGTVERPLEATEPAGEGGESAGDWADEGDEDGDGGSAWQVVRFNAWQHQHVDPPWWALMDHVFHESEDELGRWDRLGEYWWRLSSRRLVLLVGVTVAAWLFALVVLPEILGTGAGSLGGLAGFAGNVATIVALLTTIWAGVAAVSKPLFLDSSHAARSYVEYAGEPMSTIEDRFTDLIHRIPKHVLVFIDDLDRCRSEYAVELLEGIQTLFGEAPVVFVVAADRRWLDACFAEVYEGQADVVRHPGKSLGSLFSEKAFQLSAPVPGVPGELHRSYWRHLIQVDQDGAGDRSEGEESAAGPSDGTSPDASADTGFRPDVTRWAVPEVMERTEHLLSDYAPLLDRNPRAMKQLVNAYSLNRALTTLTRIDVDRETLALWTVLSLRWPELAAYLETDPETVDTLKAGFVDEDDLADVPGTIRPLFSDRAVLDVVTGSVEGVTASLDPDAVRRCTCLQS